MADEKREKEALATFAKTARSDKKVPGDPKVTPETAPQSGDLGAEQKDAADIFNGNATGDKAKTDAAISREAQRDKRGG